MREETFPLSKITGEKGNGEVVKTPLERVFVFNEENELIKTFVRKVI